MGYIKPEIEIVELNESILTDTNISPGLDTGTGGGLGDGGDGGTLY